MESNSAISLILVLLSLLAIQIVILFILKRMIMNLNKLTIELNLAKHRYFTKYSKDLISEKSLKTCQNCFFRQSFFKNDTEVSELLFYRCKVNGTEIALNDSCSKFQLESFTQDL